MCQVASAGIYRADLFTQILLLTLLKEGTQPRLTLQNEPGPEHGGQGSV